MQTRIKELMESAMETISPDATLKEAAQKMASVECGSLPVGTKDNLQGMITDRDIVVRAVAMGKDITKEKVRDYMTPQVCACHENATTDEAAKQMHDNKVNRLIVQDDEGRPCGILTFGRIIRENGDREEVTQVIEWASGRRAA